MVSTTTQATLFGRKDPSTVLGTSKDNDVLIDPISALRKSLETAQTLKTLPPGREDVSFVLLTPSYFLMRFTKGNKQC